MSLESSDPTKIESDRPDQERADQERELLSGSLIDEKKLEKASLVEDEDLTGPEKNDPTKLKNEESNDDDEETGEDSSSEEENEESSSDESSSSSEEENEESSSDESSSSSSSSEEEEEEETKSHQAMNILPLLAAGVNIGKGDEAVKLEKGETEREKMFIDIDDDEEEVVAKGPIKSKHEVEDLPPVPPVDVSLEPYHKTMPVGVISSMLGNIVIVEGSETHSALNEGSILWISETRSPLGIVDEIFGPVKNPYYVIRFNSEEDVPKSASVGAAVSFVSEFAEHILNQKDVYKKGYDASGDNDEEVLDEVEFSDDEKEAEYRRSLRQEKRGKRGTANVDHDSGFGKRTNLKGAGFRKDKQPPVSLPPIATTACQQLSSQAIQLHAQASNIGWIPRTANPRPNVGPSPTMMMQTCPQAFQMGAGNPSQQLWQPGFPPRPQSIGIQGGAFPMNSIGIQGGAFPMNSIGIQGGAFPMNSIPFQQLGQQAYDPHYQQFQFNQALNMFASGLMPYLQQQILPNGGVAHWPVPASGQPLPPVGTTGQIGFGQVSFDCSNVNPQGTLVSFNEQRHPQALSQSEVRPPPVHSNRGRRPYQRGRLSYGGRGQQKNG